MRNTWRREEAGPTFGEAGIGHRPQCACVPTDLKVERGMSRRRRANENMTIRRVEFIVEPVAASRKATSPSRLSSRG